MTTEWLGVCLTSHLKGHLTQLATYYWWLIDIQKTPGLQLELKVN